MRTTFTLRFLALIPTMATLPVFGILPGATDKHGKASTVQTAASPATLKKMAEEYYRWRDEQ
ncbi:MAG TPA: hypothetical protein VEZ90_19225, partial [Blastocatellia bacterium]|nr:hypothetical protein [Blastocatellia bacterium]